MSGRTSFGVSVISVLSYQIHSFYQLRFCAIVGASELEDIGVLPARVARPIESRDVFAGSFCLVHQKLNFESESICNAKRDMPGGWKSISNLCPIAERIREILLEF